MEEALEGQFLKLGSSIVAYLPNLLAGMVLILLGWFAGWIIKRVIVQFLYILRIDRFLRRSRLGVDFSKADVRYSISNFIGNVAFGIVFFVFVDNALLAWKLDILSGVLSKGILFIPKLILAFVILWAGWLLASWVQLVMRKSLNRERIARASLIAKFSKVIVLLFFSAIAFVELDIAREIVIIGFTSTFVSLCVIAIVLAVTRGHEFLVKIEDSNREETK
jgi:Mechanosensitive ion channel, conserved TM helix